MNRAWARMAWLTGVLVLTGLGCRTGTPNVKPAFDPEVLNPPPMEARFNSPGYPKAAYKEEDLLKKKILEGEASPIMPTRGGLTPGMGGGLR